MSIKTLGEWLAYWLEVYKKPVLSLSGYQNIERVIRLHIPEELKRMELKDLNAMAIDKALAGIKSSRMRKYTFGVLYNSLNKAYRLDLMTIEVMKKAEPIKHKQKMSEPLTHAEQETFIKAIENIPQRELFLFYLYTGARRNEALTLTWKDVDFVGKTLRIRGTKTTTSNRVIYLLPEVEEILKRQKERGMQGERVFPWCYGHIDHVFKKYCPRHKLHDLRHTFITRCAESGINVNVTQALAGHSDVKMTLRIYTHVSDDFKQIEYGKFKLR